MNVCFFTARRTTPNLVIQRAVPIFKHEKSAPKTFQTFHVTKLRASVPLGQHRQKDSWNVDDNHQAPPGAPGPNAKGKRRRAQRKNIPASLRLCAFRSLRLVCALAVLKGGHNPATQEG